MYRYLIKATTLERSKYLIVWNEGSVRMINSHLNSVVTWDYMILSYTAVSFIFENKNGMNPNTNI